MSTFRDLHSPGRLLILPNAWDAGSARVIEDAGAEADPLGCIARTGEMDDAASERRHLRHIPDE